VNLAERSALLQVLELDDETAATGAERTLGLVEHRSRMPAGRRRGWLMRRMLLLSDLLGLTLAFAIAQLVYEAHTHAGGVDVVSETLLFAAALPLWVVTAKLYGLYDHDEERTDHSTADDVPSVFHLLTGGTWLIYAGTHLTGLANPQLSKVMVFWALAVVAIPSARSTARAYCRRQADYLQNTVIVGAGDIGQLIARKLLKHPEYGLNLVGFVDAQPKERADDLEHLTLLGGLKDVRTLVDVLDIERAIIAFSNDCTEDIVAVMRDLNELDVQVDIVPRFFDVVSAAVDLHSIEGLPLIGVRPPRLSRSSALLKRCLDVIGAGLGLIVLAPIFAVVAALIKLESRGPVFFRQIRMGGAARPFSIFKFRTMDADAEAHKADLVHLNKHARNGGDPRMFKIDDDPRVTRIGRVLRRLSMDELPQLWNVLRGEMSLVGPRPLILEEDAHVTNWAERRLDLKPGITGLWQVLGRDGIPFEEMVKLDYLYVTSWSLGGDLRLLLRTIPIVVRGA
jgi:exopolysaccharide biosynthesis polyprenyl glycosylphosphotransferase